MEMWISLIALLGMGYGVFRGMKWMLKAGHVQAAKSAPLSPTDLRVLEESAARLMTDLRMVTDECVDRIERACAEAQAKIECLEPTSQTPMRVNPAQSTGAWTAIPIDSIVPTLDSYETAAHIARDSGMTTGEIELMRGLKAIEHR